jgi:hypothetical protein
MRKEDLKEIILASLVDTCCQTLSTHEEIANEIVSKVFGCNDINLIPLHPIGSEKIFLKEEKRNED